MDYAETCLSKVVSCFSVKSCALNEVNVPRSVCFQLFKFEVKLCTIITVFWVYIFILERKKFCEAFACARSFCQ